MTDKSLSILSSSTSLSSSSSSELHSRVAIKTILEQSLLGQPVAKHLWHVLGFSGTSESEEINKEHNRIELNWNELGEKVKLLYRAEGNANLVLALPQFHKILRLPKSFCQQSAIMEIPHKRLKKDITCDMESSSSSAALNLEYYVAYTNFLRNVFGHEYVDASEVVLVAANTNDNQWINQHIRSQRPVDRLNKEFIGRYGLLMPDATQLPNTMKLNISNENNQIIATQLKVESLNKIKLITRIKRDIDTNTYAVEIKPKQGWLLTTAEINNLFDMRTTRTDFTTIMTINERSDKWHCNRKIFTSAINENKNKNNKITTTAQNEINKQLQGSISNDSNCCRYCCLQFIKLRQQKIHQVSRYCPINLFSGIPAVMCDAIDGLFECPQNNLRMYRNGQLIYDNAICRSQNLAEIFSNDKLLLIKQLLTTCLLRDYTCLQYEKHKKEEEEEEDKIEKQQENHQQEHSFTRKYKDNVNDRCKSTETRISRTEDNLQTIITKTTTNPINIISTTRETITTPTKIIELIDNKSVEEKKAQLSKIEKEKSENQVKEQRQKNGSPIVSTLKAIRWKPIELTKKQIKMDAFIDTDKTNEFRLPKNSILEKILQIQLLAKKNFHYMLNQPTSRQNVKTYHHLMKLLKTVEGNELQHQQQQQQQQDLVRLELSEEEEYLMAATAFDCSIMITFQEICNTALQDLQDKRFIVCMNERCFLTKVTLLDLDPKDDGHFSKFCQQIRDICKLQINKQNN